MKIFMISISISIFTMNMALLFCIFRQFAESNGRPPNGWLVPRGYSTEMSNPNKKPPRSQSSSPISTPPLTTRTRSNSLPHGAASGKPYSRPQSPLASPASSPSLNKAKPTPDCPSSQTADHFGQITSPRDTTIDVTSQSINLGHESPTAVDKPKRSLKCCPCGKSSGGKAWLLSCVGCCQTWHNSCANLKGKIPKTIIDNLDHWLCPWCYVCPYQPPKGHKCVKQTVQLNASVISDSITTQVEDSLKTFISSQNNELVETVQNSLNSFSEEIQAFKDLTKNRSTVPEYHMENAIESIMEEEASGISSEQPFSAYRPEFVTDEYATQLKQFLDQENFTQEGKRGVASYGEKYKYMGAKSQGTKPIPDILKPLLKKVNGNLEYELNQILVNKYTGPEAMLPRHSDDEYDINPMSDIFTLSIGDTATVVFESKNTSEKTELPVESRSLYSMTRSSQNFYSHQINANASNSVRYSITIRSTHWTFLNSLIAIGDSNLGKIQFGEGKGKVGKSTPGKRDWAPTVNDIVPEKCMSYKNVVIMVGTNDLKIPQCDVMQTYKKYKGKLEQIKELNPRCNLYVCPVLPSRSNKINENIFQFNRLLFGDLLENPTSLKVNIVRGLGDFLDRGNLLKSTLHDQRTNEDVLHINDLGYRILVRCIKKAIFNSKLSKTSTGRTYAGTVRPS